MIFETVFFFLSGCRSSLVSIGLIFWTRVDRMWFAREASKLKELPVDFGKTLTWNRRFRYIAQYTCTNTEERPYFIRDASKSFPSGHSSVSVYGAIFMIWYLQCRTPKLRSSMAIPLCQMVLATWAMFCSLSRIIDNRHHWWDVLAGAAIGAVTAFLTVSF